MKTRLQNLHVWLVCPCIKLLCSLFSFNASMPSKSIALRYRPKLSLFQNAGHMLINMKTAFSTSFKPICYTRSEKNVHFSTCAPNVSYWLSLARISAKPLNQISRKSPPSQHSGKWVKYSGNIYELNGGGMCSKKALGHFFAWQTTAQPGGAWF